MDLKYSKDSIMNPMTNLQDLKILKGGIIKEKIKTKMKWTFEWKSLYSIFFANENIICIKG